MDRDTLPTVPFVLPRVEAVDAVPREALPALVAELAALAQAAAARMQREADSPNGHGGEPPDELLEITEAARRLGAKPGWLRHNGDQFPFVVRLSPGQVRYSAKGIERWIAARLRTARR